MNVLITGCSRGIGKCMLDNLINEPSVKRIFALSSNSEIIPNSEKVVKIHADFLSEQWEENLKKSIRDEQLNVIINNAGYLFNGSIETTSEAEIHKMYRINYYAPLRIIQLLHSNAKEGRAHIVNIGSMGGFSGSVKYPGLSVYSSTKSALVPFHFSVSIFLIVDESFNFSSISSINFLQFLNSYLKINSSKSKTSLMSISLNKSDKI